MALGNNVKKQENSSEVPANEVHAQQGENVDIDNLTPEQLEGDYASLRGLVDAMDAVGGLIEYNLKGEVMRANNNFLRMFEYDDLSEIRGKHHAIFAKDKTINNEAFKDFVAQLISGNTKTGIFPRLTKYGREIWIQGTYTPIRNDKGEVIRVAGMLMDITEQHNRDMEFVGQMEAFGRSSYVVSFDMEGVILDVNEMFLDVMGYTREEVVGNHGRMLYEPGYVQTSSDKMFWESLQEGIMQSAEVKRVGKHGNEIWIQATYNPLFDSDGNPYKIVAFATDVTDLKKQYLEISRLINNMAEGNLRERYEMDSSGDIATMGTALNKSIDNLNRLLGNITQVANLVASSAEEMLAKGEQMKNTTAEVASATQQMAEGAQQQAQQTDESSKLVDNVLKSSIDVGEKSKVINNAAEIGQAGAAEGLGTIRRVVENMNEIQSSAKTTSQSIEVLTQRSEEIARTLHVITDIASQTNLLALNAAIEAARAGEAGRGFAVVAEEIRKLAEDSRRSAVDIERLIREVQKDVNNAGKAINNMESNVKNGNQASQEAESVFHSMEQASQETLGLSKEILGLVNDQKDAINSTVRNIEKIVVVSEETASGTEQVAVSARELSQGMNEVTATSRDLADVANQLLEGVSKFQLRK